MEVLAANRQKTHVSTDIQTNKSSPYATEQLLRPIGNLLQKDLFCGLLNSDSAAAKFSIGLPSDSVANSVIPKLEQCESQ